MWQNGKKLDGLTAVQEKNAQVTVEKRFPSCSINRTSSKCPTSPDEDNAMVHQKIKGVLAHGCATISEDAQVKESLTQSTNKRGSVSKVAWIAGKRRRIQKTYDPKRKYKGRTAKLGRSKESGARTLTCYVASACVFRGRTVCRSVF